jgi:hypothetical protein
MRQMLGRYSSASVAQSNFHESVVLPQRERNSTTCTGVAQSILEKIADELGKPEPIPDDLGRVVQHDLEVNATRLRYRGEARTDVSYKLLDINRVKRDSFAGIRLGQRKEVFHDACEAINVISKLRVDARVVLGIPSPRLGKLDLRLEDSQRRSELVGCIRGELLLPLECVIEASDHRVEGRRQSAQLIVCRR